MVSVLRKNIKTRYFLSCFLFLGTVLLYVVKGNVTKSRCPITGNVNHNTAREGLLGDSQHSSILNTVAGQEETRGEERKMGGKDEAIYNSLFI